LFCESPIKDSAFCSLKHFTGTLMPSTGPDFTAASSALGYLYQVRYALVLLLQAENTESVISIEKLDDIAFEVEGEASELLQAKHHRTHTASLGDSSTDLWKTLRVWSVAVKAGSVDLASTILSLLTTAEAAADSAAALLRPGPGRDVARALEKLRQAGAASGSQIVQPAFKAFQELTGTQQEDLIGQIGVLDMAPDILRARELLETRMRVATRPKFLVPLCDRLEGWWFSRVIEHLNDPKTFPGIAQELVLVHVNDLNDQFRLDNLPIDFPNELDINASDMPVDDRIFVEQLRHIMVSNERIKSAISDYYRAFRQRSKWVREDLILDSDLLQYEGRLVREWKELFLSMKEQLEQEGGDPARLGWNFYNSIINLRQHIPIRPSFSDPFLMRGSYHILANSLKIGWHPQFEELFAKALEQAIRATT
jgi:hypothetical protein